MNKRKNVVYASDERFAEILAVSMESLLQNNSDVTIYIINNGMEQTSVDRLVRQAHKYNCEIFIMPVEKLEYYAGRELSCQSKITTTSYFRLFLPVILPEEVEKVLYIDCDTLICDTLDKIFSWQLCNTCGGVVEPTAGLMKKKIGLNKQDAYINAGVLLIDLKRWRDEKIHKKFVEYIEEMNGNISFEDQGVINHVLCGKIDHLPIRYNVETQYFDFGYYGFQAMKRDAMLYSQEDVEKALNSPGIIHFTNSFYSERPWIKGSQHKYLDRWQAGKRLTEWAEKDAWDSKKDIARKVCNCIYRILPQKLGNAFIYFVNGVVRPIIT